MGPPFPSTSIDMREVYLLDSEGVVLPEDGGVLQRFISLPHPATSTRCVYLLAGDCLLEIQKVDDTGSSWFFGNNVIQDGGYCVVTHMDPLFILLPLLSKHQSNFSPLSQLMASMQADYPDYSSLMKVKGLSLDLVCDTKTFEDDDMVLVRFNEKKALEFLADKHRKVARAIWETSSKSGYAVHANGFVVATLSTAGSSKPDAIPVDILTQALHIVADYLTPEMASKLTATLDLQTKIEDFDDDLEAVIEKENKKRSWEDKEDPADKIRQLTHGSGLNQMASSSKSKTEVKATNKKPKLDGKGMKTLGNFFVKAPSTRK